MQSQRPTPFEGTARFAIEAEIGAGGMGVVYRAFDRERGAPVALKVLRNLNPLSLYRFKREFRALADVDHPNLVRLHELFADGEQWFFTMELVRGRDFLDHVRGEVERAVEPTVSLEGSFGSDSAPRPFGPKAPEPQAPIASPAQFDCLRASLRQLADGVNALHEAGHLHRDIKPSNALVADDGRVVLLDFGVIAGLERQRDSRDDDPMIVGTPSYMAPEQAAGMQLCEATDWYSVGVILFEALTGRRPAARLRRLAPEDYTSAIAEVLDMFAATAPSELVVLCEEMLAREPASRPSGAEVLARLEGQGPRHRRVPRSPGSLLIGRNRELRALEEAFAACRAGRQRTLRVHGRSGIGKTALVHFFLQSLDGTGQALVLHARCYERESVPYKALDPLVDAITRELLPLDPAELAVALPAQSVALARLFPVLSRVPTLRDRAIARLALDPLELRQRANEALRELLRWLARRRPVVMAIDDVQWGDADSAAVLADALRPPRAPAVLLLLVHRTEEAEASPFLRRLAAVGDDAAAGALELGPLGAAEAGELATALLERVADTREFDVDSIARESQGSPFFLGELVQYVVESGCGDGPPRRAQGVSLDEVVRSRVRDLPASARRLLEAASVAGRPTAQAVVRQVAGLDGDAQIEATAALRTRNLIRTRGTLDADTLEVYHDRIREAVLAQIDDAALRAYHREFSLTLAGQGGVDPEALAIHFEGAGEPARAARHYEAAAELAVDALAFGRAAALYRRAIDLGRHDGDPGAAQRARLGDALAKAGRAAEAADAFLDAAALAGGDSRTAYQLYAAEQLLRSGHIEEGLALLGPVVAAIGLAMPRQPWRAVLGLVSSRRRLRRRLAQPAVRELGAPPVAPAELRRIRLCWSAASALGLCDPLLGAYFQAQHLLMALAAGEPSEIARGLAIEASYASLQGRAEEVRARELIDRSRTLANRMGDDLALAWSLTAEGLLDFGTERWSSALEAFDRAEPVLREVLVGATYELHGVSMFRCFAHYYRGDLGELARSVPDLLRGARGRGDVYAVTDLQSGLANLAWLVADDTAGARAAADEAAERWKPQVFQLQHYWELVARTHIALYTGDGRAANALVCERWRELARSRLLKIHMVGIEALHLRAAAALACAAESGDRGALRRVRRDGQRLERVGTDCARALAAMIAAGVAAAERAPELAASSLETAIARCQEADMHMYAEAARFRLGRLVGGDAGRELEARASGWMAAQSVAVPEHMVDLFAPGFAGG